MSRGSVIVTGGAGYIGSHTCKALARAGYKPVTYDSLFRGHAYAVKWGPLEHGDIVDGERLRQVFRKYSPVAVFHFAGLAYVGESIDQPLLYHQVNVAGSLSLLAVMQEQGVERLVFSSSCATYGVPTAIPIAENAAQVPVNPYGWSKLQVERIIRDVAATKGLSAVALRYFNAAGADPDGEVGECHDPETHIIPRILAAARGDVSHLTIFGDDYPTPDGTCIRDYIHVSDLADAHVRALTYLGRQSGFCAFNLGVGTGFSIRQLITAAEAVTGRKVPFRCSPRRPGDPPMLIADASLAKQFLGWGTQYSELETIFRTAWNWIGRRPICLRSFA